MLVEDWEEMKNEHSSRRQVIDLPVEYTVDGFLADFLKTKNNEGTEDKKKWEVFTQGLKLYFNKSLPTLLLYKSERPQYTHHFTSHPNLVPSGVYGIEHFCRMLVKLPYLLNSTGTASEGEVKSLLSKVGQITRWVCRDGEDGLIRGTYRKPEKYECGNKDIRGR
jgi:mortality factor 4-like protein 1